jgi:hypothetical protein
MILEQTSPVSAEEAATETQREISTRKQFRDNWGASGKHWLALENAFLAVGNSSVHAAARPFKIASALLEALKTARPVINPLWGARKRDLLQTRLPHVQRRRSPRRGEIRTGFLEHYGSSRRTQTGRPDVRLSYVCLGHFDRMCLP